MHALTIFLLALLLAACATPATAPLSPSDQESLARTAEAHEHDTPVATPAATTPPVRPVTGSTVTYGRVDGKDLQGYLARPASAKGPLPGLIVIHEWRGLNDNVRDEAARLAAEGYVVLAVDLYQGRLATAPPEAMKLSRELTTNPGPAEANLRAAYAYLEDTERAPRIGSIGWCLGGRWSLRTALLLPDRLDATVIYYGSVQADETELARLQLPVLGLFAANDRVVPAPTVAAFEATMKRLGKDVEVHVYPATEHAFANPSGTAYQAAAAEDAWRRTTAFLAEHLTR